jgi:competence ComEA-like helix-hairpin-helix protein
VNAGLWLLTTLLCCALCSGAALAEEPAPGPAQRTAAAIALPGAASAAVDAAAPALIDLNRAGVDELTSLPGIGQKRAEAILAFRDSHGGFQNVAQLLKIKGIGRAMLRKLRALVTIGNAGNDAADVQLAQGNPAAKGGSRDLHRVR